MGDFLFLGFSQSWKNGTALTMVVVTAYDKLVSANPRDAIPAENGNLQVKQCVNNQRDAQFL